MQVKLAKTAGFCLGVSLALKRLDMELAKSGTPEGRLITFGPIIHNPLVMEDYERKGVLCLSDTASILPGDRVVIRAHGIPKQIEEELKNSGAIIVDATCPKVKRAQLAIAKTYAKKRELILFGEENHPEVRGLLSYAGPDSLVFGSMQELEALDFRHGATYFLAAQTTQERGMYLEAKAYLEERFGKAVQTLDTICDATRERQDEVRALCETVEAMVVVGGLNSGNTRRLAEVASSCGAYALHIEQASDITKEQKEALGRFSETGLTAGASTPKEHIAAAEHFLLEL